MDGLLQLIDEVYKAAFGERSWEDLAPEIARVFNSTSTSLQVQRQVASSANLSMTDKVGSRIDDYGRHYWRRDTRVDRAVATVSLLQGAGSEDLVAEREFEETEFYQDWCRHLDVSYVVGSVFSTECGELGVLGIHHPRSAGTCTSEDKQAVAQFLPHLQRALRLRELLGSAALIAEASREMLGRFQTAAVVVTGDGRVLHANPDAAQLLAEGSAIRWRNGRISSSRETDAAQLLTLIRAATCPPATTAAPHDGAMLVRRPNGTAVSVLVAPFKLAIPGLAPAGAIVFARDSAKAVGLRRTLKSLFGLTPTEARIAEALAHGRSLEEIAGCRRSNLQTVRKQVKAIFVKTGTHRQAECVALILRSVATLKREG